MKTVALILASVFIFPACFADPPKTEQEFLTAVRAAYEAKDVSKIDALFWDKGVSAEDKQRSDNFLAGALKEATDIQSVSLEQLPPGFRSSWVSSGRRIEMACPPTGFVKIAYVSKGNSQTTTNRPYAVIEGRYYLVTVKTTDLGWTGLPDRKFIVNVPGVTSDKVKVHIKYNASGVDLEDDMIPPTNSEVIMGQYITEVTVTSEDPDANRTLNIQDGGKTVYESEPLKGKGQLVYKKPD